MKRILTLLLGSALALTIATAAFAQSTEPVDAKSSVQPAPEKATPPTETAPPASTPPPTASTTAEEKAPAKANPALDRVKEKAKKAPAKERADLEKKLDEIEKQIETEASSKGDATVAGRIAGEFGVTADALTAERSQYSRGWGELLVAHTLLANAKTDITIGDMFQMRNEGMGWGEIAHGLDLRLGDVVSAVRAEGRVATGLDKGDGKATSIKSGASVTGAAKVGKSGAKAKGTSAAGAGVGVGVDLGKAKGGK